MGRFRKSITEADYATLGLELIVVILGILIAIQIDGWASDRNDRKQELDYLQRLKTDLVSEVESMDNSIEYADSRIAAVRLLERVAADPPTAVSNATAVAIALETVTWRSFPQINAFIYSELQHTGNLSLVQSDTLRVGIAAYYASLRHDERVAVDRSSQREFAHLTSGLLTTDELIEVEEGAWQNHSDFVSEQRGVEIARMLGERDTAVMLLPHIAQHNAFTRKSILSNRDLAIRLIQDIDKALRR